MHKAKRRGPTWNCRRQRPMPMRRYVEPMAARHAHERSAGRPGLKLGGSPRFGRSRSATNWVFRPSARLVGSDIIPHSKNTTRRIGPLPSGSIPRRALAVLAHATLKRRVNPFPTPKRAFR